MRPALVLLAVTITLVMADKTHFQHWYKQYRPNFQELMTTPSCVKAYDIYLHDIPPSWNKGATTEPVVNCIMSQVTEAMKSNMAAAAVLLGLLPVMLSLLGSNTREVGLVALRRPFLAFLLAASAPAVSPTRPFENCDPRSPLESRHRSKPAKHLSRSTSCFVSLLQYLIAIGTIFNIVQATWELRLNTVCSFSLETAFMPALWAFLAVGIHAFGTLSVILQTRIVPDVPSRLSNSKRAHFYQRLQWEWRPSVEHPRGKIKLKEETYLSIWIPWFTSVGTVLHIIFGTLVFSSIMFVSTRDAIFVVLRYLASTIVSRAVVMYELSGMRQVMEVQDDQPHVDSFSTLVSRPDKKAAVRIEMM